MIVDLRNLQKSLAKYSAKPLYFLVGSDEYLVDEALGAIKSKALVEGLDDFNYNQFYGNDVNGSKIKDHAETLPVMSEMRLVLVKKAEALKEKDWDILSSSLEGDNSSCCLVFVFSKLDKRKKFYKLVQKNGVIVELKSPYDNQVPDWINYIAGNLGLQLSAESKAILFQLVGNHLIEIKNELSKLKSYKLKDSQQEQDLIKISKQDVLKVVSKSKFENVFELTKAIGKRDRGKALFYLAQLLDSGQNEVATLSLVKRHMRILGQVKRAVAEGQAYSQLGALVGVPQFFIKEYNHQAKSWSEGKILSTMEDLKNTDIALKTSPLSSHIWLENFIIKSCQ